MLEAGIITFLGFVLTAGYLGYRRVAGYAIYIDIGMTVLLMWIFMGTYAGMMTGLFAGVLISFFLKGVRYFFGYETLKWKRNEGESIPRLRWTEIKPTRSKA